MRKFIAALVILAWFGGAYAVSVYVLGWLYATALDIGVICLIFAMCWAFDTLGLSL